MVCDHVHISHVSKLGASIPCVNLPPVTTCDPASPCFQKCYARKGRFRFKNTVSHLEKNLLIFREDPEGFKRDVIIAASTAKYFRWHSSGDIPNIDYLHMMFQVANAVPDTHFLCFTKRYDFVNSYLMAGAQIPANLTIVFSVWGDYGRDRNPYYLPVAYIQFKDNSALIPGHARKCPGYCGDCVAAKQSCWDMGCGDAVYFNEH